MTYPGGAPGGYPGQGPQQPIQGPGYGRPPGSGPKLGLPQIMYLVVAGLGLINFFVGFADAYDGASGGFFSQASALPGLFLLGGLFVVPAILPGGAKAGISPAAFSVTGMLTVLFFTFSTDPDIGVGTILMLIFGLLQARRGRRGLPVRGGHHEAADAGAEPVRAPAAGACTRRRRVPGPAAAGPVPAAAVRRGQATTFAPQQGQFGQPGQHPGTPPGGYPQQ